MFEFQFNICLDGAFRVCLKISTQPSLPHYKKLNTLMLLSKIIHQKIKHVSDEMWVSSGSGQNEEFAFKWKD